MRIFAWTLPFLLLFLTSCGSERVIEKPVIHEVVRIERIAVPSEHLVRHIKTTIPETISYGEAIQLWSEDRAIIEIQNGQLEAIEVLNDAVDD